MIQLLQAIGITKLYKNNTVLSNVSIFVRSGQCLGILGDNGSGKSTLMSIITSMTTATKGDVLLDGKKITKEDRLSIGYVPQDAILVEDLSVRDNLKLWASVYKLKDFKAVISNIPEFLGIDEFLHKKVSTLSGGMKKKVAIAIALMNNPRFIILDEAFASLDAKTIVSMISYLKSLENVGIIYSSHNLQEITQLCQRVVVLKKGVITYTSPEASQPEIFTEEQQNYLISLF